jgi:alanyl-tRNA synthetase
MQSIDTGMGLERIGALLQGKHDNYDTDLMRSLIEASANVTSHRPGRAGQIHHRVIADHLRSTSFLIADGVMPSNEGRGYVLRRIMRRAMRHAHMLGAQDPVMHRLVPALVRQMGAAYPELSQAAALIEETLRSEETKFKQTLDRGLRLLDDDWRAAEGRRCRGAAAFKLYDTYGFPLDLTQDALREKGRTVDVAGFDAAMAEQKAKARAAWSGSGEAGMRRSGSTSPKSTGRPNSSAMTPRRPRADHSRWSATGRDRRSGGDGRGADRGQPDAVLCRIGRPGRRCRHHPHRYRHGRRDRHPKKVAGVFIHMAEGHARRL